MYPSAVDHDAVVSDLADQILQGINWGGKLHTARIPYEYGPGVIDSVIERVPQERCDLIVVLTSGGSWRSGSKVTQGGLRVHAITSRPKNQCGQLNNTRWASYERANLVKAGRARICPMCRNYSFCHWPHQWTDGLRMAQVVVINQRIFGGFPRVLSLIKTNSDRDKILFIFEDADFLKIRYRRVLDLQILQGFIQFLDVYREKEFFSDELVTYRQLIGGIANLDRQTITTTWFDPMPLGADSLSILQRRNLAEHGGAFRFPIYEIQQFCESDPGSRYIDDNGNFSYYLPPALPGTTIIFGPQDATALIQRKINSEVADLTPDPPRVHSESLYFNLSNLLGTKAYFTEKKNIPLILGLWAQLIVREIDNGMRVVTLVRSGQSRSRSSYVDICIRQMNAIFAEMNRLDVSLVNGALGGEGGTNAVPLLTYGDACNEGTTGSYRDFDTLICFSGFYFNDDEFRLLYNERELPEDRIELPLNLSGAPKRRSASSPAGQNAQQALDFFELGMIQKAISCVRPLTHSRAIFTMQCGQLPGVRYDKEFHTLAEFRDYLNLGTRPELKTLKMAQSLPQIYDLRMQGLTQMQVAEMLGISVDSLRPLWKDCLSLLPQQQH